jgi:hypothetical protein
MKITAEFLRSLRLSLDELIGWIVRQAEQILALLRECEGLRAALQQKNQELVRLEEKLAQTAQRAFRQAAPFRVPDERRNPSPGRPGRRAGHPGSYRPKPTRIDQRVKVLLEACPHCQGPVQERRDVTQYVQEIPPVQPQNIVFTNSGTTVYVVEASRGRQVVHQVLGADYAGVLVSDCLATYDDATALQHKCYSHHFVALKEAMAEHPQQGEGYLSQVRALLRTAMIFQALEADPNDPRYEVCLQTLEQGADALLSAPRAQPQEEQIRNRLWKQRDHLFTFLKHPGVEATNNRAERQLRPAVIARKVSCGNKTKAGARTWEILTSVAVSTAQAGESFVERVRATVRLAPAGGP